MRTKIRVLGMTCVIATLVACARTSGTVPAPDTDASQPLVVVVRHAEKAPLPASNPVLSEAGVARAWALDTAMQPLAITDVVVSHLQRTRLTADPLIARTHAVLHVVPIGAAGAAAHVQSVVDTVREILRTGGRRVLVVGHSNTVPAIVAALGAPAMPPLCDSQYSQLFTMRGRSTSALTLTRATYGTADPVDPTCAATMGKP
jgi:broad specificity phosphatase PhoE